MTYSPACMLLRVPILHQAGLFPVKQVFRVHASQTQPLCTCVHAILTMPATLTYRCPSRHLSTPSRAPRTKIPASTPSNMSRSTASILGSRQMSRTAALRYPDVPPPCPKPAELLHRQRVTVNITSRALPLAVHPAQKLPGKMCSIRSPTPTSPNTVSL